MTYQFANDYGISVVFNPVSGRDAPPDTSGTDADGTIRVETYQDAGRWDFIVNVRPVSWSISHEYPPVGGSGVTNLIEKANEEIDDTQPNDCPISDLTPLDGLALEMELGERVRLDKLTEPTQRALTCLQESILEVSDTGGPHLSGEYLFFMPKERKLMFKVESAYRPESYQRHFWEILSKLNDKRINQKNCRALKAKLEYEREDHDLGGIAARSNSHHSSGTGFDMSWEGISAASVDKKAAECGLIRNLKHIKGERTHFTLIR